MKPLAVSRRRAPLRWRSASRLHEGVVMTRILCTILVLVGSATTAFAQVQLAWKFKEGDRFYVEERSVNKQTLSFAAQKIEQQNVSRTVTEFTVRSRNQGGVVLEQKILHWRSTQTDN